MSEPITWDDLHLVWVSDFYDMPLNGICLRDGKLCEFDGDYETGTYTVRDLSWRQKFQWLKRKKLFEICIGHHWTYGADGKERNIGFYYRNPRWLYKLLFKAYYWRHTLRKVLSGMRRNGKNNKI